MRITESRLRRIIRQVISESYGMSNELGSPDFVLNMIDDVCRDKGLHCQYPSDYMYTSDVVVRVGHSLRDLKVLDFEALLDRIRDCGSDLGLCRDLVEEEIENCCL
jgi:hypothetical protein